MFFNSEEEIEIERKKWSLTREEYEKNFKKVFEKLVLIGKVSYSPNATFVMVGGQAGSGKSKLVSKEVKNLSNGAIIIDQDVLRTTYPKYSQIIKKYTEREEYILLKKYTDKLVNDIINVASNKRYNIVFESALRGGKKFIKNIIKLKEQQYKSKLSILAVSPDEANLSMFDRFCTCLEKYGESRTCTRVDNEALEKVLINIDEMDKEKIFDDIIISIRGNRKNNFIPIQVYSQNRTPNIRPLIMYKSIVDKERLNLEEFEKRYDQLKMKLMEYNQKNQMESLDKFYRQFKAKAKNDEILEL